MRTADIIRKKQHKQSLTTEEINFFVTGYTDGTIPDYQASAFCMALWFTGMDNRETADLTLAMARSGEQIDLSPIKGIKIDKHSSGGVADTTTIAVAPLAAACGGLVAKMSGRGLMHSGGTIDKLESIPGYQVQQNMSDFITIVNTCGASIIGQTGDLAPADGKLYALRDVTSTVDSLPLIASSIMSKKLASGCDKILLDVKWGNGAFMRELGQAIELAQTMVTIGKHAGKPTKALVTDMNQPLGNAVGNALEFMEAVQVLRGEIEGDLTDLVFELTAEILLMGDVCHSKEQAIERIKDAVHSGKAVDRLKQMITLHGGNPAVCDDFSLLPQARVQIPVKADRKGYIHAVEADEIGMSTVMIGAGRERKEDLVDPAVGCWLRKRVGDQVSKGDVLADFYINEERNAREAVERFTAAVHIGERVPEKQTGLIAKVIEPQE